MITAKFNLRDIKNEAMNAAVFNRGLDYYNNGMVHNTRVEYNGLIEDGYTIYSLVCGSYRNLYDVSIDIDDEGKIDTYNCTCPSCIEGYWACKHEKQG